MHRGSDQSAGNGLFDQCGGADVFLCFVNAIKGDACDY